MKIERLTEKALNSSAPKRRKSECFDNEVASTSSAGLVARSSRSHVAPVDWGLCVFCQQSTSREALITVTSFNVSTSILESSYLDNTMRVRLAGVSDLIAAGGKYHKKCLSTYKYHTGKNKEECQTTEDIAMIFLCSELHYAAEHNRVLQLSDVWVRYNELAQETNTQIPQSFISRRTSFKEKLMKKVGDSFKFVQPLTEDISEREPLLVPHK